MGDGRAQYALMDSEFRGCVRFKEFNKFCKKFKAGKLFKDADSSYSESDYENEVIKEMWQKIDPYHNCSVKNEKVMQLIATEYDMPEMLTDKASSDILMEDCDTDGNGVTTFEEFSKFCKKLLHE